MAFNWRARILEHLAHAAYRPTRLRELERMIRVPDAESTSFRESMLGLQDEGAIEIAGDDTVRLPRMGEEITGRIRITMRGDGFVTPERPTREGDLFVQGGATMDAISGDRVRVRVSRRTDHYDRPSQSDRPSGRVVEVLERAQTRFAGTLEKDGRQWIVRPDGRKLDGPVIVRDAESKGGKPGVKVVFDLIRFPTEHRWAEGAIVEVLGEAGQPDAETRSVIMSYGLREAFPDDVSAQAAQLAREFATEQEAGSWPDRLDLTNELTFTIDPPDARDYDDAISIAWDEERQEWALGVHIADVAHFVHAGSPLDQEAAARGNSTYLPRRVLPMLPEALSNGVCSLQEGVARLTRSAIVNLDTKGRITGTRLAASVIRSRKRMTYLEAQAVIDGDLDEAARHAKTEPVWPPELIEALKQCDRLAKVLRKRRLDAGMITLSLPESELVFDEDGRVKDVVPEDGAFTHTLIEMFMVEANEALARTFADITVPLIRRVHPEPATTEFTALRLAARTVGRRMPDEPTRHDLQSILDQTRGTPAERSVHYAVLRSMSKAIYSPAMIGHFALASEHYTHFTSPIRRYPDLLVHRAMDAYLAETDNGAHPPGGRAKRDLAARLMGDPGVLAEEKLIEFGQHCSSTEVQSEGAERDLRTFLVLQFLHEHHMGDELPAAVTGLSPGGNGLFITLEKYFVDGFAKSAELSANSGRAERWEIDESSGRLRSQRSGAHIGVGDRVTVRIMSIDTAARRMELMVTSTLQSAASTMPSMRGDGFRDFTSGRGGKKKAKGHKKGFKQGRRGKKSW